MEDRNLLRIGVVGGVIAAVCCFSPLLVGLLAAVSACGDGPVFTKHDAAAFDALVPVGSEIRELAGGMLFVEGPVWLGAGYLVFSDIEANELKRWSPAEGLSTHAANSMTGL